MAGKTTVACTSEQYETIISAIFEGIGTAIRPNPRIATILEIEANTGLRIGDILLLRRGSIIRDGNRYRFNIAEHKTKKKRTFTVPTPVYEFIEEYCNIAGVKDGDIIFPITERAVQVHLQKICDYLGKGYENIGTHSFRKFFGTSLYLSSGNDIELVRRLLQHSSVAITSRYLGITDQRIEDALNNNVNLLKRRK